MVSTPLQRLRKAERDLAQWYTNTLTPKGKQSTADLKAMRNGYQQAGHPDMVAIIDRDIVARHAESRQRLAELQSEVREAAAAVQAKASRQRVPATDRALADVRSILASNNATASSVAQWIVREHPTEPEYWTALHEVASQQQAAAGLVGLPAKAAAQLVREVQQAIASYEPHTFSEAEGALALE